MKGWVRFCLIVLGMPGLAGFGAEYVPERLAPPLGYHITYPHPGTWIANPASSREWRHEDESVWPDGVGLDCATNAPWVDHDGLPKVQSTGCQQVLTGYDDVLDLPAIYGIHWWTPSGYVGGDIGNWWATGNSIWSKVPPGPNSYLSLLACLDLDDVGQWLGNSKDDVTYGACPATEGLSQVGVKIYDSWLTMDIANKNELTNHPVQGRPANCGCAAHHAYDGSDSFDVKSPYGGKPISIYDTSNPAMDELSEIHLPTGDLRGKVVTYSVGVDHIETLTGSGGATFGANTAAGGGMGSWKESSIGEYLSTAQQD